MYWILHFLAKRYMLWKTSGLPVSIYSFDNKVIKHSLESHIDIHILDDSVFFDTLVYGEIGLGRAYVDGKWTTNDMEGLMVLLVKNIDTFKFEEFKVFKDPFNLFKKSRTQVNHHCDVGNTFYSKILDQTYMAYSTGIWADSSDDLGSSIKNKIDLIIKKLDIKASDKVLDIGSGWGMIANYVYEKTGCNLTGTTISEEELQYSKTHASKDIVFFNRDYRDIIGKYDKIYSIEMLEHLGKAQYEEYFKTVKDALKPGGKACIQATVSTLEGSEQYLQSQFVLTDVLPGTHIPRISWIMEAISKTEGIRLVGLEFLDGHNFEKTFREWNKKLADNSVSIDKRLFRTYEYYFSSCVGLYNNNVLGTCVFVLEK